MFRLALILHIFIGATIAGSAVIVALVMGVNSALPIVLLALAGFIAGFPVSWVLARKLYDA